MLLRPQARPLCDSTAAALADAQVLLQYSYTYLFGCYATWLLLRTGHIWAAILPHAFCNYMGFPRFGLMAGRPLLLAALAAGILIFGMGLGPTTDPALTSNACYQLWGRPAAALWCLAAEAA